MDLNASLLLRRMIHLVLTDKYLRERVLTLVDTKEENEWGFEGEYHKNEKCKQ